MVHVCDRDITSISTQHGSYARPVEADGNPDIFRLVDLVCLLSRESLPKQPQTCLRLRD